MAPSAKAAPADATASLSRPEPSDSGEPPEGGGAAWTFHEGELVVLRYRVVRLLARGGMGEVYEAEDLELRERVALKVMHWEAAGDGRALERFKREASLARRVTHPHVCRLFDVDSHVRSTAGREERIPFLTLELLRGETLADRLRRTGPLSPAEARPLIRQMAEALGAAHAAGVVHRDFKSSNVFLTERGAVVTDFGLARSHTEERSLSGSLAGTPAYMAPEQVEGREVGPPADLYALGVVMFELLTGARPFTGDTPFTTAVQRLQQPAPSPRRLRSDLDSHWEALILRCLEREPSARFASAADFLEALEGHQPRRLRRGHAVRAWHAVGAAGALLVMGVGGALLPRIRSTPASTVATPSTAARRSVALLGFTNLSRRPEAAWLSTALSEMLATELASGGRLRLAPGEAVAQARAGLGLGESDGPTPEMLSQVRERLGVDLVVLGSYLAVGPEGGGQLRLDLRLQDATTGETVLAVTESGTEARLLELVARLGGRLRGSLGMEPISSVERGRVRASLPADPEAARHYAEGLAKLHQLDALGAKELLAHAAEKEPTHPLVHSALGEAWRQLGHDARAAEDARQAHALAGELSREERLRVEGQFHAATQAWDEAIAAYRTLFDFFPDDVEYGLGLAGAQQKAGRPEEVYATLASLRALPPPAGTDPRIDELEAHTAFIASDYARARDAAARAVAGAKARGAWVRVAEALVLEGRAHGWLRAGNELRQRWGEALALYERLGDPASRARALLLSANMKHEAPAAERLILFTEAAARLHDVGNQRDEGLAHYAIAHLRWELKDFEGARLAAETYLSIGREANHRGFIEMGLLLVGDMEARRGGLDSAARRFEEALTVSRSLGNARGVMDALLGLGDVLRQQGRLAEARARYEEAREGMGPTVPPSSRVRVALRLARAALDEGRADAESLLRAVVEDAASEGPLRTQALLLHSQALLASGREAEAAEALRQAQAGPSDGTVELGLRLRLQAARVRAASGAEGLTEALGALRTLLREAEHLGFPAEVLDVRLALGELALRAGRAAEGRALLRAVEREARARGYGLWVGKALSPRRHAPPSSASR